MKRTPTGRMLIGISWVIFFIGIAAGLYFWCSNLLKTGTIILAGSVISAVVLRLLANINEFLFNLSQSVRLIDGQLKDGFSLANQNTKEALESITQGVRLIGEQLKDGFSLVNQNTGESLDNTKALEQNIREINCDSRDINQNLHKLTSFLEEIQKYLHLKR